jgi:FAD/FMN-containing dehydrogenase
MVTLAASDRHLSWGRCHRYRHKVARPHSLREAAAAVAAMPHALLPFGRGRSYGDTCLNADGILIDTAALDRFVTFDRESGILTCEAGVTLADILDLVATPLPDLSLWFLPVSPGTRFVTVAGAIANDVHGKNHVHQGTFGRHVLWFDLARSDGSTLRCSPTENEELFSATIGGLGLTGLILRAALRLMRVPNLMLEVEEVHMAGIEDYFRLRDESAATWDYCAAWVDVLARGRVLGRGIYTRARHAPTGKSPPPLRRPRPNVPLDGPEWLLNRLSLKAFNAAYSRKLLGRRIVRRIAPYEQLFYPLDAIGSWNRLYGRRGFFQYQCVLPPRSERRGIAALLERIAAVGQGSFLAVLKSFGPLESPGLLSFPAEGTTLALDFPNRGESTLALLDRLDEVVTEAGGRLYPAKDGRMSAAMFERGYPALARFRASIDPRFSSSFWRRTGGKDDFHS